MKVSRRHILPALLFACVIQASPASAVVVGQIDTFEDGTTQNWVVGLLGAVHPAPPANVPSGGPSGANDNYLLLTAVGGGGPGSRLAVINLSQWAGDFVAAKVGSIRMDVNNLGSTELDLRLYFADPAGGPPSNVAFSTDAVTVPAGSGWISVVFPIRPADLTASLGNVTAALTNASDVRLFHSPSLAFPGPALLATLAVDNIQAQAAPSAIGAPTMSPWMMVALVTILAGLGRLGLRRLHHSSE